jgi:hypothetical protein
LCPWFTSLIEETPGALSSEIMLPKLLKIVEDASWEVKKDLEILAIAIWRGIM